MAKPMYQSVFKIMPTTWLPNSIAKSLTIQNLSIFTDLSCYSYTFLRGDWSSHKKSMGEYQKNWTHHDQLNDNVGI